MRPMWLLRWDELLPNQQKEVRAAFIRWQHDPTSKTFEEWAQKHAFYFTKEGHLARRRHAEPDFMADGYDYRGER